MDYQSAIDYLFNQLANYQKVGSSAYKPGLDTITELLKQLNNPHLNIKTIHLAGTNGKGSVAHILASIFIENGYKVGLFTSPHIKDFRERIKINGKMIDEDEVTEFVNQNKSLFDRLNPSFFEITTAMAFSSFNKHQCDISIIETGLGGRLDSTNVITPELSIITNISKDHTNILGDSIYEIAREKAGIIKHNVPFLYGENNPEVLELLYSRFQPDMSDTTKGMTDLDMFNYFIGGFYEQDYIIYCYELNRFYSFNEDTIYDEFKTDLLGKFQQHNCNIAYYATKILQKDKGWYLDKIKTRLAFTRVKRNTNFHGRLEQISENPRIIIDASHNIDGVKNLFKEIELMNYKNLHCVYATAADKAVEEIINHFPKSAKYYLTTFNSKRSFPLEKLGNLAQSLHLDYILYNQASDALESAKQHYKKGDLIIVFGSFFLLDKIIE